MAGPYDVSTVVSRSYIPEQLQDSMQKGAENRNAHFLAEFHKEAEKKGQTVQKTDKAENPVIGERAVKAAEERKKRKGRREKKEGMDKKSGQVSSKIDFTV